jgi:[ribosomal protein S18]-alanine N-acetyltransferase
VAAGEDRWFHPHPLDEAGARAACAGATADLHYVLSSGDDILGYGLLRGWEDGYEVPSLGIAVHPDAQGRRLGTLLMHFLHAAARDRGAPRVRLRVHPENNRARRLYERLGYQFGGEDRGELVALLELGPTRPRSA